MKLPQVTHTGGQQVCCDKVCENQSSEVIDLTQQHSQQQSQNTESPLKRKIDSAAVYDAKVN